MTRGQMRDDYHGVPWPDVQAIVRAVALRRGTPFHDLDDHAQDAIERLLNAREPRSKDRRSVVGYVAQVSAFTHLDRLRRRVRRPQTVPLVLGDESAWLARDERGFDAVDALDLVRRLRPIDREALMIAFLVGQNEGTRKASMVGKALKLSDNAAQQRISRARRAARDAA